MNKRFILNFTPTGMIPTREMTPRVPLQPAEIASEVLEAAEMGANMAHLHARDPIDGSPSHLKELYAEIIAGIRSRNRDLVLCVSTSGRNCPGFEERSECLDLDGEAPLADNFFDVVTMLAVFEHIRVDRLTWLITEIHRVLKPGGVYVMTTPSGWTGPILTGLKIAGLVSKEEIDEHEDSYSAKKVRAIMAHTPFQPANVRIGYFELGMNLWMQARKA